MRWLLIFLFPLAVTSAGAAGLPFSCAEHLVTPTLDDYRARGFDVSEHVSSPHLIGGGPSFMITHKSNRMFYAEAYLSPGGILNFTLHLRTKSGRLRVPGIKGSQIFKLAMELYGERVRAIKGEWFGELNVNLTQFNRLTSSGTNLESAALQTWTGRQAERFGYTQPAFAQLHGRDRIYSKVSVLFLKPK